MTVGADDRLPARFSVMIAIAVAMLLAASIWFFLALRYHDVVVGAALFLVLTSLFPAEVFGLDLAGLNITADRLWLVALGVQLFYNLKTGRMRWRGLQMADACLLVFLGWLVVRTAMHPLATIRGQPSTVMHLMLGYLVPAVLYFAIRQSRVDMASLRAVWWALGIFGVYLGITAVLETLQWWSLVFPKCIADPTLSIHFGRARGPMLQSVRLGMFLCFCLAALWTFTWWLQRRHAWAWWLSAGLSPLLLGAGLLTKTRSIWMGMAAVTLVCVIMLLRGKVRTLTLGGMLGGALLGVLVVGPNLVSFKREYSEAETRESTYMRAAFAYVSWQMIWDRPIIGFGFNQFQVYNRPYLDDRSTTIRLESIRGYVHHNSYLSLLVDLGLIGGVLYGLTALGFLKMLWRLSRQNDAPPWHQAAAVLAVCAVSVHAIQMAFHEVSFTSIENGLLALALGIAHSASDDASAVVVSRAAAPVREMSALAVSR